MQREYERPAAHFVSVLQSYLHILICLASRLPAHPMRLVAPRRATLIAREFSLLLSESNGFRLTVAD